MSELDPSYLGREHRNHHHQIECNCVGIYMSYRKIIIIVHSVIELLRSSSEIVVTINYV